MYNIIDPNGLNTGIELLTKMALSHKFINQDAIIRNAHDLKERIEKLWCLENVQCRILDKPCVYFIQRRIHYNSNDKTNIYVIGYCDNFGTRLQAIDYQYAQVFFVDYMNKPKHKMLACEYEIFNAFKSKFKLISKDYKHKPNTAHEIHSSDEFEINEFVEAYKMFIDICKKYM